MLSRRFLQSIYLLVCLSLFLSQRSAFAWSFAAFGDTRASTGNPGINADAMTAIANDINTRGVSFAIIVGDNVLGESGAAPLNLSNQIDNFQSNLAAAGWHAGGDTGSGLAYYPVRGNHDQTVNSSYGAGFGGIGGSTSAVWRAEWPTLPQNGPTTGSLGLSEVGLTYSFTVNDTLILANDFYRNTDYQANINWVNSQLNNSVYDNVVAFGHGPAYQVSHSDGLPNSPVKRQQFLTALYNAGGKLYIAGHDHLTALGRIYEKSAASGGTQGMYQLVIGGGGAPLTNFDGVYNKNHATDPAVVDLYHDSDSAASVPYHYAYAVVTIEDDLMYLKIYGTESLSTINWQTLHSLVISGNLETNTNDLTENMTNDAGVTFNQASDGTYSGVMSGLGNLTKEGTGKVILSGANTYNGSTTVNSGTLSVTGNSGSTAVTVNSSGAFMGTGTVLSLLNYGIVKPGSSVGTLNLAGGAYTQGSGGMLEIEVDSTVSFDKIIGASTASLDGTLSAITAGTYALGDTLSGVIQTTGGVSGAFASLRTQITPTIIWKPAVNGNNLDLVATRVYNNDDLKVLLNASGRSVADALAALFNAAQEDLLVIKNIIDGFTTNAAVVDAYEQISPEKLSGFSSLSFGNAGVQLGNIQSQISSLRADAVSGFSYNRSARGFSGSIANGILLAYEGDDWAKFIPRQSPEVSQMDGFGFFINGKGSFGDQQETANQPGFDYAAGGLTAGVDYRFSSNFIAGFDSGYTRTTSRLGGSGGKVDVDTVSSGLFGTYYFRNGFYLDASGSLGVNFYNAERTLSFGGLERKAESDCVGKQYNLFLGSGYDFSKGPWSMGPTASLAYSKLWIPDFTETGAGSLNLQVEDQDAESLQSGLGWKLSFETKFKGKSLIPNIFASYQHEFANESRALRASLAQGSDIFQVQTDKPSRDFALLGCGIGMRWSERIFLSLSYQAQVGQRNYFAQDVEGSVHVSF